LTDKYRNLEAWDTGMGDHLEKPYDFYEEAEPVDTTNVSAKANIVCQYHFILDPIFYLYAGQDGSRFE